MIFGSRLAPSPSHQPPTPPPCRRGALTRQGAPGRPRPAGTCPLSCRSACVSTLQARGWVRVRVGGVGAAPRAPASFAGWGRVGQGRKQPFQRRRASARRPGGAKRGSARAGRPVSAVPRPARPEPRAPSAAWRPPRPLFWRLDASEVRRWSHGRLQTAHAGPRGWPPHPDRWIGSPHPGRIVLGRCGCGCARASACPRVWRHQSVRAQAGRGAARGCAGHEGTGSAGRSQSRRQSRGRQPRPRRPHRRRRRRSRRGKRHEKHAKKDWAL